MKQIQLVSPDFVSKLWDSIQPFFDASLNIVMMIIVLIKLRCY
jgi:hypothetical protein